LAVNTKPIVLPLETLLLKLEAEGFKIGVDTRISLQKVLKELGKNFTYRSQDLKQILCPLVVKNRIEQERFNQLFDNFYSEARKEANKKLEMISEENIKSQNEEIKKEKKSKAVKGIFFLFLGIILITAIIILFYDDIKEIFITTISSPNTASTGVENSPDRNSDISNFLVILIISIFVALILIWLALNFKKLFKIFKHKKAPPDKTGIGPPYFLPFPDQSRLIQLSPEFYDISNAMRQRSSGDIYWLDIPKSVTASARAGGFPRLEFKQSTRPTEYLVLINKQGIHNQQAKIFEYLVDSLKNEDIYVDKFFYHTDPHICWNKEFPEGLSLQQLHERYPNHRILVFGDGDHMVNSFEGKLSMGYKTSFENWKERALLTPVAVSDWGYREHLLNAELFDVLPGDIKGQLALVENITNPEKFDFKRLKEQFEDPDQESVCGVDFDNIIDLKDYFKGENHLFNWFCALAISQKPYWELTLAIGKKLEERYYTDKKLVNYTNLLKLTRIKWLQTGDIPLEIMEQLSNHLEAMQEIKVLARQAVLEILQQTDVPEESFANREKETLLKQKPKKLAKQNGDFWGALTLGTIVVITYFFAIIPELLFAGLYLGILFLYASIVFYSQQKDRASHNVIEIAEQKKVPKGTIDYNEKKFFSKEISKEDSKLIERLFEWNPFICWGMLILDSNKKRSKDEIPAFSGFE
jgi:hypothetical protein